MSSRTVYLSRLLGLTTLIVVTAMAADKPRAMQLIHILVASPPALTLVGALGVVAGLAMVLFHQAWRGGLWPAVVSVLGWVILLRGVALLFVPPEVFGRLLQWMAYDRLFYGYLAGAAAVGLYLTIQGFGHRSSIWESAP